MAIGAQPNSELSRVETWFDARGAWPMRGMALLAGMLATLGHAPFQIVPAFIVAIVVLVWLLDAASRKQKRAGRAFALGWWFGLGHMSTGLYWISSAFNVDSQAWGPIWGVPAVFALAGGLALFWGAGAMLAMALWTRDMRRIAWFAVALTISEYVRGHVFGGFPWLLSGYIWTPGEPTSQLASIFGIYGLTAITLLIAAAPATIADGSARGFYRFAPLLGAALLFGLTWGWGARRMAEAPVAAPGAAPIVRVADSGLSQAEKWDYRRDQEWRVLSRYIEASGPADESDAQIVIWPEGAIPTMSFFMLDNPAFLDAVAQGMGDRVLITGLTRCEPKPDCDAFMRGERSSDGLRLFNSAAIIDGVSGAPRLGDTYDKNRLVPFGEFIPLWNLISQLNIAPLQRIGAGFEAGPPPARMILPEAPPAVVLICYEAIFPNLIPRGDERPGWIVSVTNDAWFGNGTGPWQHYAMARFRAIEEGIPLARAASGGVSAIVDSFGREVRATRRQTQYAQAQLPASLSPTAFSSWGFLLTPALIILFAALRFAPFAAAQRGQNP